MTRKTWGKAITRAPRPRAAAPNQTRVAQFMPTTAVRAAASPFSMPVATAKMLAGPGVTAITAMTPTKARYRCGSTGSAAMRPFRARRALRQAVAVIGSGFRGNRRDGRRGRDGQGGFDLVHRIQGLIHAVLGDQTIGDHVLGVGLGPGAVGRQALDHRGNAGGRLAHDGFDVDFSQGGLGDLARLARRL